MTASKPHISREDLDAEGFGYWPEEAQAAIIRRDEKMASLEEQLQAADEFKAAMVRANQRQVDDITSLREQLEAAQLERDHYHAEMLRYRDKWDETLSRWGEQVARAKDASSPVTDEDRLVQALDELDDSPPSDSFPASRSDDG